MPIEHDDVVYVQADQTVDGVKTFIETPLIYGSIDQSKHAVTVEYLSGVLGISIDPQAIRFVPAIETAVDALPSPIPPDGTRYINLTDSRIYEVVLGSWSSSMPNEYTATIATATNTLWMYYGSVWHSIVTGSILTQEVEEEFTLTSTDITNKYIDLDAAPIDGIVIVSASGAPPLYKGIDYDLITDGVDVKRISWFGFDLDGRLAASDMMTVIYTKEM